MAMTMENRLNQLKDELCQTNEKCEIIFICEDEIAHKNYISRIGSWKNKFRLLQPVTCSRQIATICNSTSNHPSVIFFGSRFLMADDFLKDVLKTLEVYKYDTDKVKIELYKIV